VPLATAAKFNPVLVGPDFVAAALKLLSRKCHHLLSAKLTLSPRWVSLVNWQGVQIEAEPVECSYPDYARAVPDNPPVRAVVARQELVAAVEPLAGFLRPTARRAVKLAVAGEALTLTATLNETYPHDLLEALKTFGGRESNGPVSICAHDLGAPHVLACASHETYVLMPMRV
jgi:hypothetical protein